ncbi:spermidine synthase [Sphingomonas nostoxanthinifaciens]|nr:spermidine synthase [Sphingomonas nostoxanthinifaciens]
MVEEEDRSSGVLVDSGDIPGGGRLYLVQHGDDYEILLGDEQLMGSWASRSEEALATLVCDRLDGHAPRILIGGLGMGFTLAAARSALPSDATIVVAELVPAIVGWARGPLAHIVGDSLEDPRVSIAMRDVHDVIVDERAGFDAILLDVDNGPDGLVTAANERLYCNWGLRAARAALRPGGTLAVWSAYADDTFSDRLRTAGFSVEEINVDSDGTGKEPPHVIWLATAQAPSDLDN